MGFSATFSYYIFFANVKNVLQLFSVLENGGLKSVSPEGPDGDQAAHRHRHIGVKDSPEARAVPRPELYFLGRSDLWGLGAVPNYILTLGGSLSAVSKPMLARKYSFCSMFQQPRDMHPFYTPLETQTYA